MPNDTPPPSESLPPHLSPGRFLIGYAAAAFYGPGRSDSKSAERARQELDAHLMRVCPAATREVATAMHNHFCQKMGRPPIIGWEEYIDEQIRKGPAGP